jgi:hypothetical protein
MIGRAVGATPSVWWQRLRGHNGWMPAPVNVLALPDWWVTEGAVEQSREPDRARG